jgi:hypothetical protein
MIEAFSGPFANAGDAVGRNLLFAIERINARGGVKLAGGARTLQLETFDSKGQVEEALTMFRRAADARIPFVLQGNSSAVAAAFIAAPQATYTRVAIPVLQQFRPELILISAGFDAHMDDPLAGMRLTGDYFGRLTRAIANVADATARGRLVALTEGGYDLVGLATSLRESISALAGDKTSDRKPEGPTSRGEATITAVTPHLSKYWKL